jgi:hypothetical protein
VTPETARAVGKVRWFDPSGRCGVLADVRGTTFFFDRLAEDRSAQQLPSPGELVHFTIDRLGGLGPIATDVRPAARSAQIGADSARRRPPALNA